jgi:hypothetical protein
MTKDGPQHDCPRCGKRWLCLAESPPQKYGAPLRRIVECVYGTALRCPPCAREEA